MAEHPPQTASDLFDMLLPLGIQAYPDRVREINAVISFSITGDGGGLWQLDCTSSPPKCYKGEATQGSGLTIELDHEDLKKIMANHNTGVDLYFQNKLRVSGDNAIALKLGLFFDITRPQPGPSQV